MQSISKFRTVTQVLLLCAPIAALAQIPTGVTFEKFYDQAAISFDQPTFVGPIPGDPNGLIVVERAGQVVRLTGSGTAYTRKNWFTIDANIATHWDGAWNVEFHPKFLQNHLFYVMFRLKNDATKSVIDEWTTDADGVTNPRKVRTVITFAQKAIHASGNLHFGSDGYLYSSQGDRDQHANGGPLMSEMWGKVIRIDVDRKDPGLEYAIPSDNPFKGQAGARGEIWALGFRMPWRFSFDRVTNDLILGDVGNLTHEEVNVVKKGGNYGSGFYEGKCTGADCAKYVDPILSESRAEGYCVIGGYVYRNDPTSAFYGTYIFGDFGTRKLYGLKINDQKTGFTEMKSLAATLPGTPSAIGQDGNGNIYAAMSTELGTAAQRATHVFRLKHAELRPMSTAVRESFERRGPRAGYVNPASAGVSAFFLDGRRLSGAARGAGNDMLILKDARTGETRKWVNLP